MKFLHISATLFALFIFTSCQSKSKKINSSIAQNSVKQVSTPSAQTLDSLETAYFASGCFWCVEAIFESVKGVEEAVSGYSGGSEKNPTYEQVGGGRSNHAEAVKVYYDPKVISFTALVQVFFGSHDPTTLNRQGPDKGPQYRSIAFYKNDSEKQIINGYIKRLKSKMYTRGRLLPRRLLNLLSFTMPNLITRTTKKNIQITHISLMFRYPA